MRASLCLFAVFALAACNLDATPLVVDGNATASGGVDSNNIAPTEGSQSTRILTACPRERPLDNTSCPILLPAVCEYASGIRGTDESIDPRCTTLVKCIDGAWTTQREGACPLAACPNTRADITEGSACTLPAGSSVELICDYPEGACGCTEGTGTNVRHARSWACIEPQVACGAHRPRIGQRCLDASPCEYGSCTFANGLRMFCESSVWTVGESKCD